MARDLHRERVGHQQVDERQPHAVAYLPGRPPWRTDLLQHKFLQAVRSVQRSLEEGYITSVEADELLRHIVGALIERQASDLVNDFLGYPDSNADRRLASRFGSDQVDHVGDW